MRTRVVAVVLSLLPLCAFAAHGHSMTMYGAAGGQSPTTTNDNRTWVVLPGHTRLPILDSMRAQLRDLARMQALVAQQKFDEAAQIAKSDFRTPELHLNDRSMGVIPKPMQAMDDRLHEALAAFADGTRKHDVTASLTALAKVTDQCVACHSAFRMR